MVSSYLSNPILLGPFLVVGLVLLGKGADWLVDGASKLAKRLGVTDLIIGLTIVAFGTSMPEFVVNMVSVAAFKHNNDIAIGNVVGSNIFNVFFILGTSAIIKHLPVYPGIKIDAALVAVSALAVWLLLCNKNRSINRWGGVLLLVLYAGYLTYRLLTY